MAATAASDLPSSEPAVIRCRGLRKHFFAASSLGQLLRGRLRGRRIDALAGVDLEVAQGEVVGVLGANGAGKSTLLRLIAALLEPDDGELSVLGQDVREVDHRFRARVCYVLAEERSFAWRLDGRQNLAFFAALHGLRGSAAKQRIEEVLERVQLGEAAGRAVREYSSGMRQRLALARGLLGEPRLFLFDEPTRGVDPRGAAELRRFLREELLEGRTAIVATHDLGEVRDLCQRVVALERGKVLGSGAPHEAEALLGLAERGS